MLRNVYSGTLPQDVFWFWVQVVLVQLFQPAFKLPYFVLEVYDIVSWNLRSFGLVKVLALRICPFARTAAWKTGVATRFPL